MSLLKRGVRVLHVLAPAREGGLERVVSMLSEGQGRERAHVAAVLTPDDMHGHPFIAQLFAGAGRRREVGARGGARAATHAHGARRLEAHEVGRQRVVEAGIHEIALVRVQRPELSLWRSGAGGAILSP